MHEMYETFCAYDIGRPWAIKDIPQAHCEIPQEVEIPWHGANTIKYDRKYHNLPQTFGKCSIFRTSNWHFAALYPRAIFVLLYGLSMVRLWHLNSMFALLVARGSLITVAFCMLVVQSVQVFL